MTRTPEQKVRQAAYAREYRRKNADRINARIRELRRQDPEKYRSAERRRNPKRREAQRDYRLRRAYGIDLVRYNYLWQKQDGRCAVCSDDLTLTHQVAVDHDHATGKVRGLLCSNCNVLLGMAQDNEGTLKRAIEYLREIA